MALNLKLDTNDIPSLLQILGLGGLSRQAAQDDSGNDFAASGGVATHPAYGGGGDGAVQRPDINYSEAHANSMPDNTSTPPFVAPPVDPSLGGAGDPTAQPRSLMDVFAGSPASPPQPINPGQGQVLPPKTRLDQLREFLNPPAPIAQNFEGMPIGEYQPPAQAVPDAGPIAPRRSLADIFSGAQAPAVAPPNTFSQNHPKLSKFLKAADEFALTAGPGIGAPTFGQGFEASLESAQRRKAYALQNADIAAKTAHTQAETQAIQNPQGKPTAGKLVFDKADNIIGYQDTKGNLVGPKNPNLPQDVRDMIDAAEQRTHAPTTPEGQVMSYLVNSGKTPAEAYQFIQDSKQNSKPDTAAQNKQNFQNVGATLAKEFDGNMPKDFYTNPKTQIDVINSSKTLTPEQKQFAQGYLMANPTPASQALNVVLRGETYAQGRPVKVYDNVRHEARTISLAENERADQEEPGRYTSPDYTPEAIMSRTVAKDLAGGKMKDQIVSFNTLLYHIGDASDGIDEIRNTKSPLINRPMNWLKANAMGDPNVSNLVQRFEPVKKEFESFLLNNRALYAEDRSSIDKILNENQSPAQMQEAMKQFTHTAALRLATQNDSYKRSNRGQDIPDLVNPQTKMLLDKFGVTIPGWSGNNDRNTGGAAPAPQGMISVQIPGHPPGHIPASARKQFLQDNPGAKVIE